MNNTIFNFNKPLLDLTGKPFLNPNNNESLTLGSQLASALAQHTSGDALKLFGWAMAIYNNKDIILDKSDQIMLEEFIKNSGMSVILKAQLLEVLN